MKAKIFHNIYQDGIEVKILDGPKESLKSELGNFGFRYSSRNKVYYAKYSNILWNMVRELLDEFLPEDEKQSIKKEISIPEIDMDIFDKTHIKKKVSTEVRSIIYKYIRLISLDFER